MSAMLYILFILITLNLILSIIYKAINIYKYCISVDEKDNCTKCNKSKKLCE